MAPATAPTIQHPKLGNVRGRAAEDGSGVAQFLGIKYASLKDRFAPPELLKGDPGGTVEAGEYGPRVVSLPNALDMELSFIQQTLPQPRNDPPPPPMSDVDGLNLNITVPPAGTPRPGEAGFPVLVFIHGGGLFIGANWWPHYDFKRLVKLGVERGVPFVGVNVGYRLGIPGFLTSAEMQQAGYRANNGLRDQATALLWIKENIAGFGGDPDNVTIMGESAGGASCLLHLQSPSSQAPLFARVISMGGTPFVMRPLPAAAAEHTYAAVTSALDLTPLAPAARLAALRTMPAADLVAKAPPGLPLAFVHDDDTITQSPTHASLRPAGSAAAGAPGASIALLAGYAAADASIVAHVAPALQRADAAAVFAASLRATLDGQGHPGLADKLCAAYGIGPPGGSVGGAEAEAEKKQALHAIVALATDLLFRASARAYVDAWPGREGQRRQQKAWLYRFALPNPWPGPWQGAAAHILDVALLFGNFEEALPDAGAGTGGGGGELAGYRQAARQWAERVLRFVAGGAEGPGWDAGSEVGVFAVDGVRKVAREDEVGEDRLAGVLEGEGVGVDVILGAWERFVRGE